VKSYIGNLGAAANSTELAASLLALQHGLVPPTLNFEEPDPACPVRVAAGEARPLTRAHVLKVGFTEMGQCAAVVVRKWEESVDLLHDKGGTFPPSFLVRDQAAGL